MHVHTTNVRGRWITFVLSIILPAVLAVVITIGFMYFVIVPTFKDSFMAGKRTMLKEVTSIAFSILEYYQAEETTGHMSREDAQRQALCELEQLRYGDSGKDYFWVNDMVPQLVMHPYSKELLGKNLADFRSPEGGLLFREILAAVEQEDSAFIDYVWNKKYTATQEVPKLSYLQKFSPWGWVVGTGVFLDDVERKTREISRQLTFLVLAATVLIALILTWVTFRSLQIERRRQKAEEEVLHSEEKYRALVEAAVEPIMMLSDGEVMYVNLSLEELLGYTAAQIEQKGLARLLDKEQKDESGRELQRILTSTGAASLPDGVYELCLRDADSSRLTTRLSISRKKMFARGAVHGQEVVILSFHDISLVRSVERRLGESKQRFRQLATDLDIGVFRVRATGKMAFVEANDPVVRLVDVTEKQLFSLGLLDLVDDSSSSQSLEMVLQDKGSVQRKSVQLKSRPHSGKETRGQRVISLSMIPVMRDGEQFLDGVMVDISKQKRLEKKRRQLIVELQTSLLYLDQPISAVIRPYVGCNLFDTATDVAAMMSRANSDCALVTGDESGTGEDRNAQAVGLVTDAILRERLLARNLAPDTKVYQVMSAPVTYIDDSALIYEALLKLQEAPGGRLAVRDSRGSVVSVVSNEELLDAHRYSSSMLLREIDKAQRPEELQDCYERVVQMVRALHESGAHARNITRNITAVSDRITTRLIELAIEKLGKPPAPFAFISLGSEGRGEQTLATDQDNGIIFYDVDHRVEDHVYAYFQELGSQVCRWLDLVGYDLCKGEVMAMNPHWCQPLRKWKGYFGQWIKDADSDDLMKVSIFFDMRTIYGNAHLTEELHEFVTAKTSKQRPFFLHLAENCLAFAIPIDFFGRLTTESGGEHPDSLNIKHVLAVIVGYGRIHAINMGLTGVNTLQRLEAMLDGEVIDRETHEKLVEAYDYLMQLRFKHQLRCVEDGIKPDNHIKLAELTQLEKQMLEKVFAQLTELRKRLSLFAKDGLFF